MQRAFAWPIQTLDFEASGLGPDIYPIEVGVARWHGPGTAIRVWSSLISPTREWRSRLTWRPESVAVHGISLSSLEDEPGPAEVMEALNRLCPLGSMVFCDGGDHDKGWMQRLADAAGKPPYTLIGSWRHIVSNLDEAGYDRMMAYGADHVDVHRAGPDARDNMLALAHAIGAPTPAVVDWKPSERQTFR